MPRSLRRLWIVLVGLALAAAVVPAVAQDESSGEGSGGAAPLPELPEHDPSPSPRFPSEEPEVKTPAHLEIVAMPVFGSSSLPMGGWGELVVRIANKGSEPARGTVKAFGGLHARAKDAGNVTLAPYTAAAGSAVGLRIPLRVSERDNPMVRIYDDDDVVVFEQAFPPAHDNHTLLVDVAKVSVLGAALRGIADGSRNDPWASHGYSGVRSMGGPSVVEVTSPIYDPVTGDPILPRRAAGYARVAAVVMRSDELVNLPAQELEALSGFLLAGGTLGLLMTRPEDLRNEIVAALVGGEVREVAVQPESLAELVLTALPPSSTPPAGVRPPPVAAAPESDVKAAMRGFEGGNLRHSLYGASASYGLGEVHVLAFDPQTKPGVDSPWVHVRMVDLLRRANERTSGVLFRHGDMHTPASAIRRQLDPNESSRWAIVVTALLLCLYSVIAGPVNFGYWRKRHRPLRALLWLPVTSAIAFGAVVGIGLGAKGCSGRARHLTLVEAGGGMKQGTARKWRGFFVPTAREMTVRASNASSVLGVEPMDLADQATDNLRVDRDGLRLEKLALRPWETLVVREDGYSDLGGGISLLHVGEKEVKVKNKTGRRLRGLVLSLPWGEVRYLDELEDNASASSKSFRATTRVSVGAGGASGLPLRDFNMYGLESKFEAASPGLTEAWSAVVGALPGRRDWFPGDVPVLLAQLDGGGGQARDTGLDVDTDRVLVRVVGYGGI